MLSVDGRAHGGAAPESPMSIPPRVVLPVVTALAALLGGCEPNYVETSAEVDMYISQGRWSAVCVALERDRDDNLRRYTAEKLAGAPAEAPEAKACACEAVMDYPHGAYDAAVVDGFAGTERDDLTDCVLPALEATTGEDRVRLVNQLAEIRSPKALARVAAVAADTSEPPEVRAAAVRGLTAVREEHQDLLLGRLTGDPDPMVRATAAEVFENSTAEPVVDALVKAATDDADGGVRAAALKAVVKLKLEKTDDMVCRLMMEDPDERVRDRAVRSFKGSKRRRALDCLEKRLLTEETSPKVRDSTMKAIYASPDEHAPKVLCRAIGPVVRTYVKDVPAHKLSGVDIVKHQNNRDFDNSYDCVQAALRQGGYSCWGRYYLADWFERLGGKAFKPKCAADGGTVVSFE